MTKSPTPTRQVRAHYTEHSVFLYQAFRQDIAQNALQNQTFVSPFSRTRMTWVKPSFTWMMYRAGWGTKPDQERILRIEIHRTGFEWALAHACLSHFERDLYPDRLTWKEALRESPVRIQWDPERDLALDPLPWRAIQIGLGPAAVPHYVDAWILRIEDFTSIAHTLRDTAPEHRHATAMTLVPEETAYPLPPELARRIGASSE